MKAKFSLVIVSILLVLSLSVACNRGRSDAQIAGDVQSKIFADSAVQSRQITVQSSNGIVTLSGYVGTEAERAAAATNAAQVEGVKTVVNNLQVGQAQSAMAEPPQEAQQAPAPQQVEEERRPERRERTTRATTTTPRNRPSAATGSAPVREYNAADTTTASAPAAAAPAPAPAAPARVTVPSGTTISVRLTDAVSSETANVGDTFRGSLDSPVVVDDNVAIPAGADVVGRVVDVKSAGRFAGQSLLTLELTKISYNGRSYSIDTNQWSKQGSSRGKSTAAKVGGGAALGALIGAIAGGGKGAAIGGAIGAGGGTAASAATKGQQINLGSETVLNFQLQNGLTVTPSATRQRTGQRLDTNE